MGRCRPGSGAIDKAVPDHSKASVSDEGGCTKIPSAVSSRLSIVDGSSQNRCQNWARFVPPSRVARKVHRYPIVRACAEPHR